MIISISLLAPSPRITKERAEAWEARESRDCTCVKATACLRSRRRLLTHTSLVLEWRGWGGDSHTTTPPSSSSSGENVDFGFSFSLCFFFLHFFFARMERMPVKGKENIIIGHMSLFISESDAAFHPPHRPTLRLRLSLPNPHYRARWDQAFFS